MNSNVGEGHNGENELTISNASLDNKGLLLKSESPDDETCVSQVNTDDDGSEQSHENEIENRILENTEVSQVQVKGNKNVKCEDTFLELASGNAVSPFDASNTHLVFQEKLVSLESMLKLETERLQAQIKEKDKGTFRGGTNA